MLTLLPFAMLRSLHTSVRGVRKVKPPLAAMAPPPLPPGTQSIALSTELSDSFMRYAMSTILGRALPDARDGLKPVHRRILYGMCDMGLKPGSQHRKCARVVGEVLGKYHPHGDASIYDALVRMAQDFVMSSPLVDGHGNFGSIDADPPAAMRYTECKLTKFAFEALLSQADLECAPLFDNFDGSEKEPHVLPARVPLLLVNGAAGIAVGMATSIPPHNLGEVCDAVLQVVKSKTGKAADLTVLPAPDFPTGGLIMGLQGVAKMYETGQGSIVVRAKTHFEKTDKGRNLIVATELPYQVSKADLLEKTASAVNAKKLEGVSDLRDESGKQGIRVVFELKRDAKPEIVRNALFQQTRLQIKFAANVVAVDSVQGKRQPMRMSLQAALEGWLRFRFDYVRSRAKYNEEKKAARLHIVQGLQIAAQNADALVALIRTSSTPAEAKQKITTQFQASDDQADAILRLQLSRLTSLETSKLDDEARQLEADLATLRQQLQDDTAVYDVIRDEVKSVKSQFATPRRSQIITDGDTVIREEDLIQNDKSAVIVSRGGYVKRTPLSEFGAQLRGGKGRASLDGSSKVSHLVSCHDHDPLLCLADTGVAYGVRAFHVPKAGRSARGVPLPTVLPSLSATQKISGLVVVNSLETPQYLVMLTKQGLIKRTLLAQFKDLTARGLISITLNADDRILFATLCTDDDDILVASKSGKVVRFNAHSLSATSRTSKGSIAMKLGDGDRVVAMDVATANQRHALFMTAHGFGKRVPIEDFKVQRRGVKGVSVYSKFKIADDYLAGFCCCADSDEVVINTNRGVIVRQSASGISVQSRTAMGVMVQRSQSMDKIDHVSQVSVVPADLLDTISDSVDQQAPVPVTTTVGARTAAVAQ